MASKDLKNSKELKSPDGDVLQQTDNLQPDEAGTDSAEIGISSEAEESETSETEKERVEPEAENEVKADELADTETEVEEESKSVEADVEAETEVTEPVPAETPEVVVEQVIKITEPVPAETVEVVVEPVIEITEPVPAETVEVVVEPVIEITEPVPAETIEIPVVTEETTEEEISDQGLAEETEPVQIVIEPSAAIQEIEETVSEIAVEEIAAQTEVAVSDEVPEVSKVGHESDHDIFESISEVEEFAVHDVTDVSHLFHDEDPVAVFSAIVPKEDYSNYSQIELVNLLREAVDSEAGDHQVEAILACFYKRVREKNEESKEKFITEGGKEDEFVPDEDPYNSDVKELLKKYKQQRFEHVRRLDAEKEVNLQKKYEIIEDIKNLLNKEESINRTFQDFRELQRKWYEIGQVPQAKMKDLWDTYHFHVENFYDYIKINKELRDLDLKKNLEVKIEICEKTEELLMETSVIKAFNALQKYHEEWRETGPVPTDKKDDIWERFKAATTKINQKHQDYFEKRKLEQKKNLDAKTALCEKAEEISLSAFDSHREWDEKSRELVELQKVWKTIGFAPKKENNKIYDRFRAACDKFFINKREYYSKNKDIQQTNLQMKIDLCLEAETLKESTDWKKTTQQFIDIQKRWKEVGAIPRKNSDAVWKRFRAACDYFFEKKAAHFNDIDGEQYENLRLKEKLIEDVENFKPDADVAIALRDLRDLQRKWTEIGHVPIKNKDSIQHRFREAINKQFDALKVDGSNRNVFNFRNKIESMTDNARGLSKVRSEREKYMIKLKQLETDLTLLDNNIGFFANSKNAQALIADVNQKIVDTREKIEQLKEKIRIIDDLDKSEY